MRKFALAAAALACLSAPAFAGPAVATADKPIVLAQHTTVITRDRGRSVTVHRDRHHHRWMARERGCRTVTIRERRGGTVVVKKIRRC